MTAIGMWEMILELESKNRHSYKIQSGLTVYWYLGERCAHINAHPYVEINFFIELLIFVFYFASWNLLIKYILHNCITFVMSQCVWNTTDLYQARKR